MIDGFDLEAIPIWLERIGKGEPLYKWNVKTLDDYLTEFPEGPFADAIKVAKANVVIKEDDPLPTPEEIQEALEQAEIEATEKKKAEKKAKRARKP